MNAPSLTSDLNVKPLTTVVEQEVVAIPRPSINPLDIFFRLVVIVSGMFFGCIAAYIVGLFAGWIQFC